MASSKIKTLAKRFSQLLEKYAIWPTFLVSIILLLLFYHQFIVTDSFQKELYLPLSNYTSLDNIPLWNPNINSGMPIWGNPQDVARINIVDSAIFAILAPLKPFVPDINFLYLFLNLLMLGGFTFALMRKVGIRPFAASFVAITVLFIPQYVINIADGRWIHILAISLIPAILYFTLLLLETRKLLWFVLGALFFTVQLLRASAAVSISTVAMIIVLYLIYCMSWRKERKFKAFMSRGLLCLAMIFSSFLMAAYVYFPFLEFVNYTIISKSSYSFSINDILLYAYPSFNGDIVQPEHRYILYFSVLALFMAGFAVLLRRNWRTFLLMTLSITLIFFAFLGYWGPAIYAIPFIVLILAGIGVHAIVKYRQKARNRKKSRWLDIYMLMVLGIFTAGFAFFLINQPGYLQHILKQMPLLKLPEQHVYYQHVLFEGISAFVLIGIAFILVRLYLSRTISAFVFVAALLCLTLLELLVVDYKLVAVREKKETLLPQKVLEEFDRNTQPWRVFSTTSHLIESYQSVLGSSKSILKTYDGFLRSSGFGQIDVQGMRNPFFSKYTRLVVRRKEIVEEPIPVDYIDPTRLHFDRSMLDMLNVKYIISNSPIHDPNYFVLYDSIFFVYENTSALSRAFFVDSVYVLPGRRAIFDAMRHENFDPKHIAFLEQEPPFQIFKADSNSVNIVSHSPGRIELRADVKQPTSLVLSTVHYPVGWQAYVDEQKVDFYKTNYFMRSLFLNPGTHTIRLEFLPQSFKIGVWVSLFSFSLFSILLLVGIVLYFQKNNKNAETT